MTPWTALNEELDVWVTSGEQATLWWRDDDAVEPTPHLTRMQALANTHSIPLALAVIPKFATNALAAELDSDQLCTVMQHGLAHTNHAPADQKKAELGAHRPMSIVLGDLQTGRDLLTERFHDPIAVLVPPWNRIATEAISHLPDIGLTGLSTFSPRKRNPSTLITANTHVDLINWKDTRGFAGADLLVSRIVTHLADRRAGHVDPAEPTGLLTHHLVHDDQCWQFLDDLFSLTQAHPAARWLSPRDIFITPDTD